MRAAMEDRVAGAIVGALIGDALGMGVHWYYDLDEMRRDHGDCIRDYCKASPGRYHDKLHPGDVTQSGYILKLTLQSLVANSGYNEEHFCEALDAELFPKMDGTPMSGPGGYTSQSMRAAYAARKAGVPWSKVASGADTTEAIERNLCIGLLYALRPQEMAQYVSSNTVLTQNDEVIVSLTVAFNAVLAQLASSGKPMNEDISDILMGRVKRGVLPFHSVTGEGAKPPEPGAPEPPRAGNFASPDALLTPGTCAAAATDCGVRIEPAWKVSLVYGMPCAAYHVLPACYYLAARYHDDFEEAVLQAVNGGGQNCARTMLTGALVGAQVGLSKIPARFVNGLTESKELVKLAKEVATMAAKHA